ncbi:hypothetical protein AX14_012522 [Amanita brunnescens Koide BX004]|nr:hypothetical protein AX14_012522 [Amanita brunnescens Koide BX004]
MNWTNSAPSPISHKGAEADVRAEARGELKESADGPWRRGVFANIHIARKVITERKMGIQSQRDVGRIWQNIMAANRTPRVQTFGFATLDVTVVARVR